MEAWSWFHFEMWSTNTLLPVNVFQKHLFLHQLTHNMTKVCSLIYFFLTWKLQAQNMLCAQIGFLFLTFRTIYVHNIFLTCSELGIFMYRTRNSMNKLLSYCGLVDPRISASDKDLPVNIMLNTQMYIKSLSCISREITSLITTVFSRFQINLSI